MDEWVDNQHDTCLQPAIKISNSQFWLNEIPWVISLIICWWGGVMNFSNSSPTILSFDSQIWTQSDISHTAPSEKRRQGPWNQTKEAGSASPVSASLGPWLRWGDWYPAMPSPRNGLATQGLYVAILQGKRQLLGAPSGSASIAPEPTYLPGTTCRKFFASFCTIFHCDHADSCRNTWRWLGSC